MKEAFELQAKGVTRSAYYTFKDAYQRALILGVPSGELSFISDLFYWYRRYGYSAGITPFPARVSEEYYTNETNPSYGYENPTVLTVDREREYQSELGKNPEQAKHIRQFLMGAGMVISGIFAISVDPPLLAKAGWGLCVGGFTQMYMGLSNGWAEWEIRCEEIKKMEANLKNKNR